MPAAGKPANFLRIAHRGASRECPENTLVAFRRAVEQRAQMIECDLQLAADGSVVVMHDWTVDRTTDGSGAVSDLSLAELRRLDAGRWHGERFAGERVPTLDEVLDTALPHVRLNLELKCRSPGRSAHRLALAVVAAVSQREALDRVIFSSFDVATLEALREVSPHARIGLLWSLPPYDLAWELAAQLGAVALHPRADVLDGATVAEAHARGLSVHAWTVNDADRMVELARMGTDGLFSDLPGRLLEARARLLAGG